MNAIDTVFDSKPTTKNYKNTFRITSILKIFGRMKKHKNREMERQTDRLNS